jgi:NADPH:quinone reductase-like Zn-dependent oxidoreductase
VVGLSKHGVSTSFNALESSFQRLPGDLGLEEAVTLPVAFAMAIYSLTHLVNMSAMHKILIHSASSDTGAAAIQLSQSIGAEVSLSRRVLGPAVLMKYL